MSALHPPTSAGRAGRWRRLGAAIIVGLTMLSPARAQASEKAPPLPRATRGQAVQVRSLPDLPPALLAPRVAWPAAGQVAVTFDDGPCPTFTRRVVEVMAHRVATFYVVGVNLRQYPNETVFAASRGHSIQNHSWAHSRHRAMTDAEIRRSTQLTGDLVARTVNVQPKSFRPPYGSTDTRVRLMIESMGYRQAMWNAGPDIMADAGTMRSAVIRQIVNAQQRNEGLVILFHDCSGRPQQLLAALPDILASLDARGFEYVALG